MAAQAQLSFAQANYTRQQELSKENVTAKRVFQEAEASYKSLQAKVNSLQSQFGLIGINASSLKAGNNVGSNLTSAVLSTAIANYSGSDYIFVQRSNGDSAYKFERIKIKKGITNGGYTEVTPLETIQDDAKIVTNGAFYLMAILTNAGEEE